MIEVERQPHDPSPGVGAYGLLDARIARRAEAWHAWEVARVAAVVQPGDTVLELGEAAAALAGALAERAGWVFAAATEESALGAQRAAFDSVRPHNLTLGPLGTLSAWCGRADVVVAADWLPRTDDPDAEFGRLVEMAARALIVTGWRTLVRSGSDSAPGVEQALAFARRHRLGTRSLATPVDDGRQRTILIIEPAVRRS